MFIVQTAVDTAVHSLEVGILMASIPMSSNSDSDWLHLSKIRALWALGGIIVSIATAIITSTLYINTLLERIARLEGAVASITKALSFDTTIERRSVTFNGNEEDPKCPSGSVMRGVRISSDRITSDPHGSIDCINIKPN